MIIQKIHSVDIDKTYLTTRMSDYPTISQGKTRVPGVNDGEEFELTDVSFPFLGTNAGKSTTQVFINKFTKLVDQIDLV